jgi:hypothetical protein
MPIYPCGALSAHNPRAMQTAVPQVGAGSEEAITLARLADTNFVSVDDRGATT